MIHYIQHIAVLIPARNEEKLLPRCLLSVLQARARLPADVTCDIIVAVDRSADRTFQIAESTISDFGAVAKIDEGIVGAARAFAAGLALMRYRGLAENCWLANTDADCAVPDDWLIDQLLIARGGTHAIAGTVDVDNFLEHHLGVERRFRDSYKTYSDGTHPHVHGANIGIRADTYLEAGGWASLTTAEDHDLWNRLSKACRKMSIASLRVVTSGRRVGRAPHGFAQALAAHNEVSV